MTTLQDRPHTALVVIGVQNDVVEGAHQRDAVVADIRSLVDPARDEQVPVAHTSLSWTCQTAPGRTAGTVPTEQVAFR